MNPAVTKGRGPRLPSVPLSHPRAGPAATMGEGWPAARQVTAASPVPAPGPRASPPTPRPPLRRAAPPAGRATGPHHGLRPRSPARPRGDPLGAATGPRPRPRTGVRAEPRRPRAYPRACSVSSSLSPSIPHVSWSSSSRLCWLAADSLSSAIAAARAAGAALGAAGVGLVRRRRQQLPLVPPAVSSEPAPRAPAPPRPGPPTAPGAGRGRCPARRRGRRGGEGRGPGRTRRAAAAAAVVASRCGAQGASPATRRQPAPQPGRVSECRHLQTPDPASLHF